MTYATRTATCPDVWPDEVGLALAGVEARLTWPSIHWGVEAHRDAWPHILAAALDSAAPMIQAKAKAQTLLAAAADVVLECTTLTEESGACDDCAAQGQWLRARADAILTAAGLERTDLQETS